MSKTYIEASNTLPVYDECDVLVVGGGAAGHSAAVAAARVGAKVIVMERYGYFGGRCYRRLCASYTYAELAYPLYESRHSGRVVHPS